MAFINPKQTKSLQTEDKSSFEDIIKELGIDASNMEDTMRKAGYNNTQIRKAKRGFEKYNQRKTEGGDFWMGEDGYDVGLGGDNKADSSGRRLGNKKGKQITDIVGMGNDLSEFAGVLKYFHGNKKSKDEKQSSLPQTEASAEGTTDQKKTPSAQNSAKKETFISKLKLSDTPTELGYKPSFGSGESKTEKAIPETIASPDIQDKEELSLENPWKNFKVPNYPKMVTSDNNYYRGHEIQAYRRMNGKDPGFKEDVSEYYSKAMQAHKKDLEFKKGELATAYSPSKVKQLKKEIRDREELVKFYDGFLTSLPQKNKGKLEAKDLIK